MKPYPHRYSAMSRPRSPVIAAAVRRVCGTHPVALLIAAAAVFGGPPVPAAAAPEQAQAARLELLAAARKVPDPAQGARLFETCSACHGVDGLGASDGTVPAIAGQHGSVLLKQLVDFRHEGRWDERMQHFTDRHHLESPQDLADVAAYAARLPRFGARVNAIGTGDYLQAGASVYFRMCETCHGPLGQGDLVRFRPRLAGQSSV